MNCRVSNGFVERLGCTYALVTFSVYFQRLMVDIVDQLLLHVACAIRVHGLLDCIAKSVLRLDWVDRSISALDILTHVTVRSILAFGVARVLAEEVSSCSDHSDVDCVLLVARDFYGGPWDKGSGCEM